MKKKSELLIYLFLIILNLFIFKKYWLGEESPHWDFVGGGMVEQFRFYEDGSFFNPPNWFPYAWFGIPEYQMLQDGAWFLPVTLTAEFFVWNPANAARVQALIILIGTFGFFNLSKIFINNKVIQLLVSTMYLFIPAFYSNAQHYGVVRASALLPWLLFLTHPNSILINKWKPILLSFLIFQTIVGSYPGNLISNFYTTFLFIFLYYVFATEKKFQYLSILFISTLSGILMGTLRYLPVLVQRNSFPSNVINESPISLDSLIYLIYPYYFNLNCATGNCVVNLRDNLNFLNPDPSQRSIYIGVTALIILIFTSRHKFFYRNIFMIIFCLIMMSSTLVENFLRELLPAANFSRFGMTDWRTSFNIIIILIIGMTLENLNKISRINYFIRFMISLIIIYLFYLLGISKRYYMHDIKIAVYSCLSILFLLTLYWTLKRKEFNLIYTNVSLVAIFFATFIFNTYYSYQNNLSWTYPISQKNSEVYGADYDSINQVTELPIRNRPQRIMFDKPPLDANQYKNDFRYNRFWLTGEFGALGYHNIKDIEEYNSLFPRLELKGDPVIGFLMQSGRQMVFNSFQDANTNFSLCFYQQKNCTEYTDVFITQTEFDKESEKFQIKAKNSFVMLQNEIFSPIWSGKICKTKNYCESVTPSVFLKSLRAWELPPGNYEFITIASTPMNHARWILFSLGLIINLLLFFRKHILFKNT